jgi:uncharacterized protein
VTFLRRWRAVSGPAAGDRLNGTRAKATAVLAALQLILAGTLLIPASSLSAQSAGADTLFPAQPVGYVNDFASVIDAESAAQMDDLINRLRKVTGAEITVVTLSSIGDRDAAEVALAIGRRWKVGSKAEIGDPRRNAGLVVLLVPRREGDPNSGQIRLEVGQGLEGIVTDAAAGQVRDEMRPDLASGQYGKGLLLGVRSLASRIAKGYGVTDSALTAYQPPASSGGETTTQSLLPLLLFIFFILLVSGAFGGRRRRRSGIYWGGPWIGGGGWGGGGGFGGGGGGFGGFGGGGGFSGGGAGGRF